MIFSYMKNENDDVVYIIKNLQALVFILPRL
jgi:hypothetical protein